MSTFKIYTTPTYAEFKTYVKDNILQYLPEQFQNCTVDIQTIPHANNSYEGLVIKNDDTTNHSHPIINLNQAYAILENNILPMEEVLHHLTDYVSSGGISFTNDAMYTLAHLDSFEDIKPNLFIKVCDKQVAAEYLLDKPHFDMLNLSATFHIRLDQSEASISSFPVINEYLKTWDISELDLFKMAIDVCQNRSPLSIIPLGDMLGLPSPVSMYVCTGSQKLNDAAVLFYPETLKHISEEVKDNYYVLPSSIHELIVVPESAGIEPHRLEEMVHNANRTVVDSKDFLSDTVLYYNKDTRMLMPSRKHEQEISKKHASMEH